MEKLYKLQIYPSYEVGAGVKKFKKMLYNRIGEYSYYYSLPHISLISFATDFRREHELVAALRKSIEGFSKFRLSLMGFSHFHHSGTLYLQVAYQASLHLLIRHIHSAIRQHASRLRIPLNDLNLCQEPHMTIGSRLSAAELADGFDSLMNQKYEGTFEVSQLKLLCFSRETMGNNLIAEFDLKEPMESSGTLQGLLPGRGPLPWGMMHVNPGSLASSRGKQLSLFST